MACNLNYTDHNMHQESIQCNLLANYLHQNERLSFNYEPKCLIKHSHFNIELGGHSDSNYFHKICLHLEASEPK